MFLSAVSPVSIFIKYFDENLGYWPLNVSEGEEMPYMLGSGTSDVFG